MTYRSSSNDNSGCLMLTGFIVLTIKHSSCWHKEASCCIQVQSYGLVTTDYYHTVPCISPTRSENLPHTIQSHNTSDVHGEQWQLRRERIRFHHSFNTDVLYHLLHFNPDHPEYTNLTGRDTYIIPINLSIRAAVVSSLEDETGILYP